MTNEIIFNLFYVIFAVVVKVLNRIHEILNTVMMKYSAMGGAIARSLSPVLPPSQSTDIDGSY